MGCSSLDGSSYFCPVAEMGGCWRWCYTTCICCLSEDEKNAVAIHNEIKRILAEQKKRERREIKVLLLGEICLVFIYFKTIRSTNMDTEDVTQGAA